MHPVIRSLFAAALVVMPFASAPDAAARDALPGARVAQTAGGASPVEGYRRAYMDECNVTGDANYCSCMVAGTAIEALALKTGSYKMLNLLDADAIEALMLDVDREWSSRINNRAPITVTQSQDVMS